MSIIAHGLSRSLPFYLSGPMPCPYLPERVERKLFARLTGEEDKNVAINAALTRAGFRRSHDIVYRPACPACTACVPVRIPVAPFRPSRSLRRIAARNRDLVLEKVSPSVTGEQYELFLGYQRTRHSDSDMARMTRADFAAMAVEGGAGTSFYQLRAQTEPDGGGRLLGSVITDHVQDGLSAVYSFFSPDEPRRCLGAHLIQSLVHEAARQGLAYVYLGYWIASAPKMAYKARFRPLQTLGPEGWTLMKDGGAEALRPCRKTRTF
ncbi:MAG: arginyltransferase [Alphaproteobacteria bacterium]|nr:arginyltransferase [Alphaproteobacteria bacterium]